MTWVYQLIKALLDWLRETPPTNVQHGQAPKSIKDDLDIRVANLPRLPDNEGGFGPAR